LEKQEMYRRLNGGRGGSAAPENLVGDAFLKFSQGPDLMAANRTVNISVVGMILAKVELILTADGAIQFNTHALQHTALYPSIPAGRWLDAEN
jgi:hypothetical protein